MGLRFQKRIKVLPGVKVNLSKTGVSTSVGGPGASVNLRRGKVKTTVGAPGTGLSYTVESKKGRHQKPSHDISPEEFSDFVEQSHKPRVLAAFFRGLGFTGTVLLMGVVALVLWIALR